MITGTMFTRIMTNPGYFATPPTYSFYEKVKNDMIDCIEAVDELLIQNPYISGKLMTLSDILIFCELSMFLALNGLTAKSLELREYPNVVKWYTLKMETNPAVMALDKKMRSTLK